VASLAALALLGVSRLLGSPARNPNLAFRVQAGWERAFPSHAVYVTLMWLGAGVAFFVVEAVILRVMLGRR
jgi:hypothetical protein